ncbi:MAG TPA: hypothetical protein DCS30_13995 [Rhizobiales bacterium]|nr:hypothetical protein [Hyphomicrobiales bacterium]
MYAMGHIKPRMWAIYGDQHKGVCLVFDKIQLTAALERQTYAFDHS